MTKNKQLRMIESEAYILCNSLLMQESLPIWTTSSLPLRVDFQKGKGMAETVLMLLNKKICILFVNKKYTM